MIEVKLDLKPIPVPLIYQPIYKLLMLLAIIKYGCKSKNGMPILNLHVYMWAMRSNENYKILHELKLKRRDSIVPWSFEPGLEKTITLAIVNKYIDRDISNSEFRVKLTSQGVELVEEIEKREIFAKNIAKIKEIGSIPQTCIQNASMNWTIK